MSFPFRHPFLAPALAALLSAVCGRAAGAPPAAAGILPALCAEPAAPVAPGVFTRDVEGAIRLSEERNLPLLLAFTGSDWCAWCPLMDREVFSKKEWTSWAATNLVLAVVDFPTDAARVPERDRARSEDWAERFSVEALPTYLLLAPGIGGAEEIGRLGASRTVSAERFREEVRAALRPLDPAVLAERLSEEEREEFATLRARRRERLAAAAARTTALHEAAVAWAARIARARAEAPDTAAALEAEALSELRALTEQDRTAETNAEPFPEERYGQLLEKLR